MQAKRKKVLSDKELINKGHCYALDKEELFYILDECYLHDYELFCVQNELLGSKDPDVSMIGAALICCEELFLRLLELLQFRDLKLSNNYKLLLILSEKYEANSELSIGSFNQFKKLYNIEVARRKTLKKVFKENKIEPDFDIYCQYLNALLTLEEL